MTTPLMRLQISWRAWFSRHVLLLSVLFLAPAFLLTSWLAGAYHSYGHRVATSWYERGEGDLQAGRLTRAVDDYRTALVYAQDNASYRLRLAQALEQAGQLDAASADLHRLWEAEPANSVVNLELARLSARRHNLTDAIRYYNNAIYGVWPTDNEARQRETQFELIDYLLASHRNGDALAGLVALAADLPPDANLRLAVGTRMLRAGAEQEAMTQFRQAVTIAPRSSAALSAAGSLALRLGQFGEAARYLGLAVRAGDKRSQTVHELGVARAVLGLDPFARGLGSEERVRRVRAAFSLVTTSFAGCILRLAPGDVAAQEAAAALHRRLADMGKTLRTREAKDAQVQQDALDTVSDIEAFVASHCGPLTGDDEALLALNRSRRGQQR